MFKVVDGLHHFPHYIYTLYATGFAGTEDAFREAASFCADNGFLGLTLWDYWWREAYAPIARELGVSVYVHTVNDAQEARELLDQGVSGIYTDTLTPADLTAEASTSGRRNAGAHGRRSMTLWSCKKRHCTARPSTTGKILHIRRDTVLLPNGREAIREVADHPGGVCVLALDQDNNALLVSQFRYPYRQVLRELPAGKLERGEDPDLAARAGAAGGDRRRGGVLPVPGAAVPPLRATAGRSSICTWPGIWISET